MSKETKDLHAFMDEKITNIKGKHDQSDLNTVGKSEDLTLSNSENKQSVVSSTRKNNGLEASCASVAVDPEE
eukprot:15365946-Ditylum_brightwellii.AAC.3